MTESAEAEKIAWENIAETYTDGEMPSWIVLNATSNKSHRSDGLWKIEIYLFKKRELKSGESWQRMGDGSKILVRFDQDTGEKKHVMTYTVEDSERVKLFEAEVDVPSKQATIKKFINLNDLNHDSFELFYE